MLLNEIIAEDNLKRKEKLQRPIRLATKSELIKFIALMIGASAFAHQGVKLWMNEKDIERGKKRRSTLSHHVDFGQYLKLWRFKELKHYVFHVMKDESIKEEQDWWMFKKYVDKFNERRKSVILSSHVKVFDESMSAYIPRWVSVSICL